MSPDTPRLPGLCLAQAQHMLKRQREIGRLLKSLAHVRPDQHEQAVAIYGQALLEHGLLTSELLKLINDMQAARIVGLVLPVHGEGEHAGVVPVPCRPPPEVPMGSDQFLVLEAEPVPTRRKLDYKSLAAGEKGDEE